MPHSEIISESVSPGGGLVPELKSYEEQIESIKQDARELLDDLTDTGFNWHATPGQWSIAQCVDHLRATGTQMLPRIATAIAQGRVNQVLSQGPFRYGFIGNLFVRLMEPPPRFKSRAPKVFAPLPERSLAELAPEFITLQDQLQRRIREADGLDLARIKIASPVTKLVKLSLGQWFGLIAAHERRHLWQARQVKNNPDFPRA